MAIIATGSKTIIDLSDGKSLSVYLGANQPRTQIYDVNANTYAPNWTSTAGRLVVTPVIYANQTAIALTDSALTITWKRKEGSGNEAALTTGEAVSANVLTVSANKLAAVDSGLLTYIAYVAYADPDTGLTVNAQTDITFAMIKTGQNAKSAWISGSQVFKYANGGSTPAPTQITLTANLQNVTMGKWQYKNGSDVWTDYPTTADNASITGTTLIVKPAHDIWVNDCAALRITTSDANIGDETSLFKVSDGADGGTAASSSIAFLSNENITFAGNANGQVSAITVTCNVVAYTGSTKVTPTVGTVSGAVTGMTVTKGNASSNEIPISIAIAANATLGGAGQQSGTLTVPITSPVSTSLSIRWSKVNTGAAGAAGAAGASAVVFSLYAPNGTIFVNGEGSLTIQTAAYLGSAPITSGAAYAWAKYASGSWATISGQTASSLSVAGSSVAGMASYRCTMTYSGKTYQDVITLVDKSDNYQADIDSTAGDVFKNGIGTTCLICRLWQNGAEADPMKSTTYSVTEPTSPATGDYYYKITTSAPATALMRYSGSAWVDVTANATYKHTKTYTWYRRDKNGTPLDGGAAFATGKVIYVDGDDVDAKTVFVCEVE